MLFQFSTPSEQLGITETGVIVPTSQTSSSQQKLLPPPYAHEGRRVPDLGITFFERPEPVITPREPRAETFVIHYHRVFDVSIGPWLPPSILSLLEKMKRQAPSEQEAVRLMRALADRASEHYGLRQGKFVAITFSGKIAEVADTKIDLLRKVQGKRYSEQIFVWEVGSESFTGWKR